MSVLCRKEKLFVQDGLMQNIVEGKWSDDVAKARTAGQKWGRLKLEEVNTGRLHPRLRASNAIKKPAAGLVDSDELRKVSDGYNHYLSRLSVFQSGITMSVTWKLSTLVEDAQALMTAFSELSSARDALDSVMSKYDAAKQKLMRDTGIKVRSTEKTKRSLLAPWIEAGLPVHLAYKLKELKGLADEKRDGRDCYQSMRSPAVWPDVATPAWFQVSEGSTSDDPTTKGLIKMMANIGEQRLNQKVLALRDFLARNEKTQACMSRITVQFKEQFNKLDWVPDILRSANMLPEFPESIGAPWVFMMRPGCHRFNSKDWPMLGTGGFMISLGQPHVVAVAHD